MSLPLQCKSDKPPIGSAGHRVRILGHDVDTAAVLIELHVTLFQGEDGVIGSETDPLARAPVGSALTQNDVARTNGLSTENLHAAALSIGVTAVSAGPLPLFMSHNNPRFLAAAARTAGCMLCTS